MYVLMYVCIMQGAAFLPSVKQSPHGAKVLFISIEDKGGVFFPLPRLRLCFLQLARQG